MPPDFSGGGRPQNVNRSQKVNINSSRLKKILKSFKVHWKELSYIKDWPEVAKSYYNAKKRVSQKKVDRLYNFWNKNLSSMDDGKKSKTKRRKEKKIEVSSAHNEYGFIENEKEEHLASLIQCERTNKATQTKEGNDNDCHLQKNWSNRKEVDFGCTDTENRSQVFKQNIDMQHQKEMRLGQSAAIKENIACRMASIFENVSRHLALKYHQNYAAILEDSMTRVIANTCCANLDTENFDNDSLSSNECNYEASISESFFDARDRSTCDKNNIHPTTSAKEDENLPSKPKVEESNFTEIEVSSYVFIDKLPDLWSGFEITKTASGRRLGGDWADVIVEKIISQKYDGCKWQFKRNYVHVINSRKKGPFFQCVADCAIPGCNVKLKLTVRNQNDGISELSFQGQRQHSPNTIFARNIKGTLREEYSDKYRKNPKLDPSEFYRQTLSSIPLDKYAVGNRNGAGLSTNTHRVLASRARKSQTKGVSIHEALMKLKVALAEQDEMQALNAGQWERTFWGLIHSSYVSDKEMRVVLLDEPMLRLCRALSKFDTLFLDATGSVIKPLPGFSRILHYSLVLRHPFGAAPPLPIAEYITNEHSVESIGYFLRTIKKMEHKMLILSIRWLRR